MIDSHLTILTCARFTAVASGDDATLSWSASGEPDLSGHLATRDGDVLNVRGLLRPSGMIPTDHEARASNTSDPNQAIGGPGRWIAGANDQEWIELELAEGGSPLRCSEATARPKCYCRRIPHCRCPDS